MAIPLEQQLTALARIGLVLNPGITVEDLLLSATREEYEDAPYWQLLYTLGSEVEGEPWDRRICDGVWHLDTECIEGPGDYARVVQELARTAGVAERVSDVQDHVDVEAREAWVSYRLDGAARRLMAVVDSDWLDPDVLAALQADLEQPPRAFADLADGQSVLFVCLAPEQLSALNALVPHAFHVHSRGRRVSLWARVRSWLSLRAS
jgi:hypothetical protein